jgi:hypothetical protein
MSGPGITIQQGANDGQIGGLKSSDVAHGMTTQLETDTYGDFRKAQADSGGLMITGAKDADGDPYFALRLRGFLGEAADTTKTTGGFGVIALDSFVKSGTDVTGCGADANLVSISNGGSTTRFIFDAEGSAHADVEWTTFDQYDDLVLLETLEKTMLAQEFGGWVDENRAELERLNIAHFDDRPGHAMVNWTRLSMLLVGALRQLGTRLETMRT